MAVIEPIRITGLREFQAALKQMDGESQKKLRLVLNVAAQIVVDEAQGRARKDSPRLAKSIKVISSQREARVKGGSAKLPQFGWMDFGGRNKGRHPQGKPIVRTFRPDGRYIYPAFYDRYDEVTEALNEGLVELAREAGLDVTTSGE